jgi:predicted ATP-grasp superfamily ATP-dependent carboligase
VTVLARAARDQGVDLIIPVTDAVILPISAARDQFRDVCKVALPESAALEVVTNKLKTLELAARTGVPAPGTRLAHTVREALEQAPELGWPLVLKPQASRLYRKQSAIESFTVGYAQNPDQLAQKMRGFEGRCPVLLQELYGGTGYGVELLTHRGRPLAVFQHKRLREIPITGGASAFRESVPVDPLLYDYAVRLLRELDWTGLAMVEFKVGVDGPKLMEINGRVWGSLPLAVRSGMDFPARLADLYLSGPPPDAEAPVDSSYGVGVRARNLGLELTWIASVLFGKRRYPFLPAPYRYQGIVALLDLLNPSLKFDILSLDDPRPGLAEISTLVGMFRRKLSRANV